MTFRKAAQNATIDKPAGIFAVGTTRYPLAPMPQR